MKNIFLILFFVFITLISRCSSTETLPNGHKATLEHLEEHRKTAFHIHAAFKVYINDKPI